MLPSGATLERDLPRRSERQLAVCFDGSKASATRRHATYLAVQTTRSHLVEDLQRLVLWHGDEVEDAARGEERLRSQRSSVPRVKFRTEAKEPWETHLDLVQQPVRDAHPAHSARPSPLNHPVFLRLKRLVVVGLDVRRVEDQAVYRVLQAREEGAREVGQDRVERDRVGLAGKGGAARGVGVQVGAEVDCGVPHGVSSESQRTWR